MTVDRLGMPPCRKRRRADDADADAAATPSSSAAPLSPADIDGDALEAAILDLLARRAPGASACPSEVPRRLLGERGAWRPLMQATRDAAARLEARGRVWVTQRGVRVDPASARGPIRLRLAPGGEGGKQEEEGRPSE